MQYLHIFFLYLRLIYLKLIYLLINLEGLIVYNLSKLNYNLDYYDIEAKKEILKNVSFDILYVKGKIFDKKQLIVLTKKQLILFLVLSSLIIIYIKLLFIYLIIK